MLVSNPKKRRRSPHLNGGKEEENALSSNIGLTTVPPKSSSRETNPTSLDLCGVQVHFPFSPYACQTDYMTKVIEALHRSENALLESPTGTGKTLCLLCSTLAWQRQRIQQQPDHITTTQLTNISENNSNSQSSSNSSSNATNRPSVIIYASRTHSQLSQVVSELRNTRYRPRHAVLGSREQMCVHPQVNNPANKGSTTMSEINHGCNKLNKERKCKYRNQLDGFVALPSQSSAEEHQPILDMEDLVQLGKKRNICPFYLTRSHHLENAELIFMPYNYLFDKEARKTTLADVPWQNAIVIFDEAHNLESFASESASFDLSSLDVAGCIQETSRAIAYLSTNSYSNVDDGGGVKMENLLRLKHLFLRFESFIQNELSPGNYAGEYMMKIFQKAMDLTFYNYEIFVTFVRQVTDLILETQGTSSGTPKLDFFVTCLRRVYSADTEGKCLARVRVYRVHISNSNQMYNKNSRGRASAGGGRTISFWCFAPSLAMQELQALRVRSILVTSGTLSPLPSYSLELGLNFPHTVENPHIISPKQIYVRVIGRGVSSKQLCSSYDRRENTEYILELVNTLISLARIIPGGMLIFFPSYSVMETCIERWGGPLSSRTKNNNQQKKSSSFFDARRKRQPAGASSENRYSFPYAPTSYGDSSSSTATPWKRLLAQKAVVLEPKSTADLNDAISEFEKFLSLPKSTGCILMGVCRGKISEGIDFSDHKCRAVIITGLPFAPYLDAKVKLKREFLDATRALNAMRPSGDGGFSSPNSILKTNLKTETVESNCQSSEPQTLSGADWYTQQAHRAVNQAVGRVIRHRNDYGAVLLLDSRFGESRNQIGLSKWLRPHVQPDEGVGKAIGTLAKFYREAKKNEEERIEIEKKRQFNGNPIQLKYEQDENLEAQEKTDDLDFENGMTKIAFIQSSEKHRKNNDGSEDNSSEKKNAVVSNGENTADQMANKPDSSNDGDDGLLRGYVRPEKVLKRFDLKEMPHTRKNRNPYTNDNAPTRRSNLDSGNDGNRHKDGNKNPDGKDSNITINSPKGLEAIYHSNSATSSSFASRRINIIKGDPKLGPSSISKTISSAWSGLEQKAKSEKKLFNMKPLTKENDVSRIARSLMKNSQVKKGTIKSMSNKQSEDEVDTAKQFFELARKTLEPKDMKHVASILKIMKLHSDKNDDDAYLRSIHDLLVILVTYTDCYSINTYVKKTANVFNGSKLLELLYPLLPLKYQARTEKTACQLKWEKSNFKRNCEMTLSTEEFEKVRSQISYVMMRNANKNTNASGVMIQNKNDSPRSKNECLQIIHTILSMLLKTDSMESSKNLAESFINLISTCYHQSAKVMVKEFQARRNIERMKTEERDKTGERGVNTNLFRQPISKTAHLDHLKVAATTDIEEQRNMEEAIQKAEQLNQAKRKHLSDLKRQTLSTPKEIGEKADDKKPSTASNRHSGRAKFIANMMTKGTGVASSQPDTRSPINLNSFLKRAMTEPLLKETPELVRKSKQIKPNVPKELVCIVCENTPEKVSFHEIFFITYQS